MTTAREHFHAGSLDQAMDAAAAEVRADPGTANARIFYAEMLCFAGWLEKADAQLETLLRLDPSLAVPVGTWRRLVRAAQMRDDFYRRGAPPAFTQAPSERLTTMLEALTRMRAGDHATAVSLCEGLEHHRAPQPRVVNDLPAADVRELDDLSAGLVEVLASNGQYYWIDLDEMASLHMEPPKRPLDLLWRPARMALTDGTEGSVFLPTTYPLPGDTDALRLGRATQWTDESGIVRGQGQRMWLVGEDALAFSDLVSVELGAAQAAGQGVAG